jgi:hypothetical protein
VVQQTKQVYKINDFVMPEALTKFSQEDDPRNRIATGTILTKGPQQKGHQLHLKLTGVG